MREDLGAAVDYVLDGGPTQVGVESTIVDLSTGRPRLLRPGGVPRELLVTLIGGPLIDGAAEIRAPGTLPSHYAPRAAVELVAPGEVVAVAVAHAARGTWVAALCDDEPLPPAVLRLRKPPHLEGLARDLYALLRRADAAGVEVVVASLPPESGLGLAIADRLRHAAAPRPGS